MHFSFTLISSMSAIAEPMRNHNFENNKFNNFFFIALKKDMLCVLSEFSCKNKTTHWIWVGFDYNILNLFVLFLHKMMLWPFI